MGHNQNSAIKFGVFAKYWEPGKVKTRLAGSIGDDRAANVYLQFLKTLIRRLTRLAGPHVALTLVYAPADREPEFRELLEQLGCGDDWTLESQGEGDLGDRMSAFFERAFFDRAFFERASSDRDTGDRDTGDRDTGERVNSISKRAGKFTRAQIIGTDSPTLPAAMLAQPSRLLDINDVVLGPTEDGGYYLVAAKDGVPPIFADISWSTDRVWRQTIAAMQQHGTRFGVLPTWYDVDNGDDLDRLRHELQQSVNSDAAGDDDIKELQAALNEILGGANE